MATAAELKQQLMDRMNESEHPKDNFIKGTLIDDKAIAILQKVATIFAIVFIISLIWLFTERNFGARTLAPYRAYVPTIYMAVMMFLTKPFLRLGWLGWAFVLTQSINLSGYLFQAIQSATGIR
jgi:hypothetical protein